MTTDEMLARRTEVRLEWGEPWPGLGADGEESLGVISMSASVDDCIDAQRAILNKLGPDVKLTDEGLLLDFIATNWAVPVKP